MMHLFNKNFKTVIVNTVIFLFSLNIGWADIIITEIADPNDATGVRYIEIYNSGGSSLALTDYYIIRFTNANSGATSNIDLSSYTLAAGGFLIFAVNSSTFNSTFSAGSATVVDAAGGGPADSNGDDNHAIVTLASGQAFDHGDSDTYDIVDMFGVVGEDGNASGGTWHEFEDGRAERVSTATSASGATASSSDWNCFSDTETWLAGVDQNVGNSLISTTTAFINNGFDPGAWDGYRSVSISGSSNHFRMVSSPVAGQIYSDLLAELWTQGMTGADVTSGDNNVWTYSGTGWTDVTDISGSGTSLTAGQGFLVYVFTDVDNDGDDDLPVTLSVSGTANTSDVSVTTVYSTDGTNSAGDGWNLLGNPYATTIDVDASGSLFADNTSNFNEVVYVWDSQAGTPAYISWNGSSGSLTDGLIAPYQGFWVQGKSSSATTYTFDYSDCVSSNAGSFYKIMADNTGSMSFTITSGNYSDQTFVSFMNNGEEGIDGSDAYKLLPVTPSERVVGISYAESYGLDISNLPYVHEGSIAIPLDVMYLTVDDDYNFVTNENDVTMTWDVSSLPGTIMGLTLTNNTTNETTDLLQIDELTFTTEQKGSFPAYGSGGVNIYPEVEESQFTLTVAYSALTSNDEPANVPGSFALHPAYPNPFNSSTTISFDIPDATDRNTFLHIYDITGKLVETLVNKVLPAGSYAVTWDPKNLSSGLYIVQLKVGNKTSNQKLTFLK